LKIQNREKMNKILKLLSFALISAIAFNSCDKEPDLPWGSFDDMEFLDDFYVYNLSLKEDLEGINDEDPASYDNQLVINHVRGEQQKIDLVVMFFDGNKWSGSFNVETDITSFPRIVNINAQKMVDVIPAYNTIDDIVMGHQYLFGLRITSKEGVTFETLEIINGALRRKLSTNIRNYPGAAYEALVRAYRFCSYPIEEYVGSWTGTSTIHSEVLTFEITDMPNKVRVYGLAGIITESWGETWLDGDGSCIMEFSCGDIVTIERQWIGYSDYPDDYHMEGSGTFDPETMTINLVYSIYYTGGGIEDIETQLTFGENKSLRVSSEVPVR
jgi:hypothetical protein